jgi:hypothetical protein
MAESLDKFGEFLITNFRDSAIDHVDGLLSAHNKAPDLQTLQADLQRLTDEQRAIVRRCVIESIDSGLHDFLFALQEEYDSEGSIKVTVDGESIAEVSDGLQGEPYGEMGWQARFSKHTPYRDSF